MKNAVETQSAIAAIPKEPTCGDVSVDASWWNAKEEQHRAVVGSQAEAFVQRRSRGETHPVWDFLFTYYTFSPAKLTTWLPGVADELPPQQPSSEARHYAWPSPKARDLAQASWIKALCEQIQGRPARHTCHGLHEWAMVYRQNREQVRHSGYQLRLHPDELGSFLERQPIACTHYDAFRFFTPEARPMNLLQPTLETRPAMEQAGCLHANMDLYKWTTKLWPWVGSDLVAETFALALRIRELDMRASPYDLADLGFEPIRIETASGREEYSRQQQELTAAAQPLRERLRRACEVMLGLKNRATQPEREHQTV